MLANRMRMIALKKGISLIKILNTPDIVDSTATLAEGLDYSGDGTYLAVTLYGGSVPVLRVYKRNLDTYTSIFTVTRGATDNCFGAPSFSGDGMYLAIPIESSPYVLVYKRTGDNFTTLASLPSIGAGYYDNVSFSPDGIYLAVGSDYYSEGWACYKRNGDTFTKLTGVPSLSSGLGDCYFSPDGIYIAIIEGNSPYLTILKRSGDIFTKLTTVEAPSGTGHEVVWAKDSAYFVYYSYNLGIFEIYKRNGDSFAKLVNPVPTYASIGNTPSAVAFSPDNNFLALAFYNSAIYMFTKTGDTFINQVTSVDIMPYRPEGLQFSPDGKHLACISGGSSNTYITIFK
jgi:WD40 repeat protein